MAESNFVDYVKIVCRSGKGGRGSTHFRREKYIPKGGPDGGDGGDGGSIYVEANRNYWTLLHLRYNRHIEAENGMPGGANRKKGSQGSDKVIEVPPGTAVYDAATGEFVLDVTEHGERKVLLRGGQGGKGNDYFKTSTNQAPRYAQPGEPAQEGTFVLQLKTLADVGLVGMPNAGKSTLLAALTAAKPKIADYPFTTLVPNLGIVAYRGQQSFVMADIPGIIEGAAEGRGLGLRFLRHIERNSVLLYVIPIDTPHIADEFRLLERELLQYNPALADKRRLLAISKIDLADSEIVDMVRSELPPDVPHVFISAVTQQGLVELKDLLWEELNAPARSDSSDIVRSRIVVESAPDDPQRPDEWDMEGGEDELLDIEWDDDILNEVYGDDSAPTNPF